VLRPVLTGPARGPASHLSGQPLDLLSRNAGCVAHHLLQLAVLCGHSGAGLTAVTGNQQQSCRSMPCRAPGAGSDTGGLPHPLQQAHKARLRSHTRGGTRKPRNSSHQPRLAAGPPRKRARRPLALTWPSTASSFLPAQCQAHEPI
jgi:hypothetical protein